MAAITGAGDAGGVFHSGRLKWASQPVVFHGNTGTNIRLSKNNTVATRDAAYAGFGIVFTNEAVSTGQMLKVTVVERETRWSSGMVGAQF